MLSPGTQATVQDLGRAGLSALGVGPSGAADRTCLRQVNRLLGNSEGAAAIEVMLGGLVLRAEAGPDDRADLAVSLALTGAPCPWSISRAGGTPRPVGDGTALLLWPGDVLTLGQAPRGLRCYVGVRGGVDVEPTLGSRSTDLLAGIGPEPLRSNDLLPVGQDYASWPSVDHAAWLTDPLRGDPLRLVAGPRLEWFDGAAVRALVAGPWLVATQTDRTAVTLDGPPITRVRHDEVPTEAMVRGAIQVPPSGRPTMLLADHPVTGGYPVIAVVGDDDVDRLAQLRPGDRARLRVTAAVRL